MYQDIIKYPELIKNDFLKTTRNTTKDFLK